MAGNILDLDYLLSKVPYMSNILEYYDNVTYNIRFYMLNEVYQNKLSKDRVNGIIPPNYQLPNDSKIIIAETGVSSNYDITSLTLKTVYSSVAENSSGVTYELNMKIKEINGCSLINKITAVSKLVGYESYILQPFHIDIWFSGFEQSTGKPVKCIGNQVLTYEVIMAEVKTNVDFTGTIYNFIMSSAIDKAFNKTSRTLSNIGTLDIKSGTLREYKIAVEKYLNDRFFENNPSLVEVYPKRDYIVINRLIDGDINLNKAAIEEYNKKYPDTIVPINQFTPINPDERNARTQSEFKVIRNPEKKPLGKDIENIRVNLNSSPQSTDSIDTAMTRPNVDDTFDSFFQKLCFNTDELKNYTARPVYRVEYVGNYGGQQLHRIYVDIVFKENTYLDYYIDKAKNKEFDLNIQKVKNMQVKELQNLLFHGALRKKYEWLYNGHDTSVLEMNSSLDMLWYSNIPLIDPIKISESSANNVAITNNRDIIVKDLEKIRELTIYKEKLENVIKKSNAPLNGIRTLATDKRLYIDDIYNCIDDTTRIEYLNNRKLLEKYDVFSKTSPSTEDTNINIDAQYAKVGYNNIHQAGNLVELDIKILGDPYWLGLCSDNYIYASDTENNIIKVSTFPHFTFKMNTALGQKPDGTYDLESITNFSSIYQLIESTSVFEEGKFIQQLKGVINQSFIHDARLKV